MNLFVADFALNYLGWVLLCIGLPRYYHLHFSAHPKAAYTLALRACGWLITLVPLSLAIHQQGWDVGIVTWAATWMLSAVALVVLQPYSPRLARLAAPTLLAVAALCAWLP